MERIQAALKGESPDKIPYSFWTHLPHLDLDPVLLAEGTYDFYKKYDIDFIKTMNNGMYSIEDFGCKVDYTQIAQGGVARLTESPVCNPVDWLKLEPTDIHKGALGRELRYLELLLEKTKGEVPICFTVFSPITTAEKMCKALPTHIADGHGDKLHHALQAIAETTANLAQEAIAIGADGVFLASQLSTYNEMTAPLYKEYGVPYDLTVLAGAKNGWFNAIHAHGNNIIFELLKDYPVHAFNWHAWETLPAIDEAFDTSGKCLMGGIVRNSITQQQRNEIHNQIYNSIKLTGGQNLILTPGCVIRYPLEEETLRFVKCAKEQIEQRLLHKISIG